MKCPYLRESWVKFCQAAPFKKVIEQTSDNAVDLCTSAAFSACAAFRERGGSASPPPCPFLQESRAHVCSHDPSVRLVPCSDQVLSRCVTTNHRYCATYLAAARGPHESLDRSGDLLAGMPSNFLFTRNHMWLDVSNEHDCHIGLDALLTRVLGRVDKLTFMMSQGEQRPSLVLTTHGVTLHMVFPNPMRITCSNAQVRVNPDRILTDPYGSGWLFEGTEPGGTDIRSGLLSGENARIWMWQEAQRVTEIIQRASAEGRNATMLAADGGVPVEGAIRHLRPDNIPLFFHELFENEEAV